MIKNIRNNFEFNKTERTNEACGLSNSPLIIPNRIPNESKKARRGRGVRVRFGCAAPGRGGIARVRRGRRSPRSRCPTVLQWQCAQPPQRSLQPASSRLFQSCLQCCEDCESCSVPFVDIFARAEVISTMCLLRPPAY